MEIGKTLLRQKTFVPLKKSIFTTALNI